LADHGSKLGREHQLHRPSGAEEIAMIIVTNGILNVEESWEFRDIRKRIQFYALEMYNIAITGLLYVRYTVR
jgi:hypothetical protein